MFEQHACMGFGWALNFDIWELRDADTIQLRMKVPSRSVRPNQKYQIPLFGGTSWACYRCTNMLVPEPRAVMMNFQVMRSALRSTVE